MAIDNDLSALLPDPPPPRPARREAAIDEAMRRFDGGPAQTPVKARPKPVRSGWGRPQIAALASVALVVLVSVPIWWTERDRIIPQVPSGAATIPPTAEAPVPQPSASVPPLAAAPAEATDEPTASPSSVAIETNLNRLPQFAPEPSTPTALADPPAALEASSPRVPPPPPPAAPAQRAAAARAPAEAGESIVVTGSRVQRQNNDSTTPIVAVSEAMLDPPGHWNACTLADPDRDLEACRALADPAARGAKGRAGAQLADGLALAWQGDLDRAIAAFDRAIDAQPGLAIAYLNRGLAYRDKGEFRRALADIDRAIARDPRDARAFYHRSQLHRARGNTRRADADLRRAVELEHD